MEYRQPVYLFLPYLLTEQQTAVCLLLDLTASCINFQMIKFNEQCPLIHYNFTCNFFKTCKYCTVIQSPFFWLLFWSIRELYRRLEAELLANTMNFQVRKYYVLCLAEAIKHAIDKRRFASLHNELEQCAWNNLEYLVWNKPGIPCNLTLEKGGNF